MSKDQYVAVLPDGNEHFCEISSSPSRSSHSSQVDLCNEAVRAYGIKTSRSEPVDIKVQLFRLEIVKGKIERKLSGVYRITPPLERMTQAEYDSEMADTLKYVPVEFHEYVHGEAYDRGHSSGMEECVNIASSIVDSLLPCIKNYARSCIKNYTQPLQGN